MGKLYYCTKCGNTKTGEKQCLMCQSCDISPIPEKYISYIAETIPILNKDLENDFIKNVIKSSPNFDQSAWDRRVGYQETRKHYDDILKNEMEAQSHQPECPTCHSKNVQRISGLERGASIAVLGLFSKKINKSFKCNNCGYTW